MVLFIITPSLAFEWVTKELTNEETAVNFSREVKRRGYGIVTTKELKEWINQSKPMLIVDTMPYEDSYKENSAYRGIKARTQADNPVTGLK